MAFSIISAFKSSEVNEMVDEFINQLFSTPSTQDPNSSALAEVDGNKLPDATPKPNTKSQEDAAKSELNEKSLNLKQRLQPFSK